MDTPPPTLPKQGLGPLAWIGIGCGGIIVLIIIGLVVFTMFFGGKIKQFAEDAQKDPVRAAVTAMVNFSGGQLEIAAEDEPGKRYTVRDKSNGKLTTFYWSAKTQTLGTVEGDFSAIPAEDAAPPSPPAPPSTPAPAPRP